MPLNEADTRAKLIDPALRQCGWTEDLVFREQTEGSIVLDGRRARRLAGRVDYLLRVRVNPGTCAARRGRRQRAPGATSARCWLWRPAPARPSSPPTFCGGCSTRAWRGRSWQYRRPRD